MALILRDFKEVLGNCRSSCRALILLGGKAYAFLSEKIFCFNYYLLINIYLFLLLYYSKFNSFCSYYFFKKIY